ncbi:RecB family exonuclease [Arthrobacter crystallopoietes BAB-32]|uniref:RecB family exonuclease n=1 Tax=Arthrobacter crystallopoietes BAB-32 TaxID=1246476 RepID=N1UYE8_9MICC|nr:PD-(D/E)XK nuclease family protein [Arthrobacter crystallopoietes]EMY35411.1 RecB family exonuclease [Arthrobacter crystallopoietes BAB-32]
MGNRTLLSVPEALAELTEMVGTAQAENPFAPVTVVVPSHASGLDVEHYLGRTLNDGRGSVSVRTFTLRDLALELIALGNLADGRIPLPPMLREGAISSVLAVDPGLFADVADQPATARAIARTAMVLDAVDEPGDIKLPALVNEVLRVHGKAAAALTTGWLTGNELFALAQKALLDPAVIRRFGVVVGFMLPPEDDPAGGQFGAMLEERTGMAVLRAAGALTPDTTVYTTSDADDEARAVVRLVAERINSETPGHRIGIFYSAADPYRGLLAQRLTEAGITYVGADAHQLSDTPMARGLLRLLRLDPLDPDLRLILNVLAEGTLVWKDRTLPSSATCERLYTAPPDEDGDPDAEPPSHLLRQRENLLLFREFVSELSDQVDRIFLAESWTEAAAKLEELIDGFMGPRSEQERPELSAARGQVSDIVGELKLLQGIAPAPSAASLRSVLEGAIAAKGGWKGRSGTGVVLGAYADGIGRDLDAVYIVGAAEGLAPARIKEDPLLPDSVRRQLGPGLPTVEDRAVTKKEQFFALLATGAEQVITSPRGNLRGGGAYQLSRWITTDVPEGWRPTALPSYAHGVATGAPTVGGLVPTAQEWRLRRCLESNAGPGMLADDAVLLGSLEVRRHRRDGVFSRFNGNLSGRTGLVDPDKAMSPTRLEDWVDSPLAYFLRRILKVELFEDVALEVQIGRLQRGTLLHAVLEDFVGEATSGGLVPSSARLMELAQAAFEREANPAWLGYLWERDMAAMRQNLLAVFTADQDRQSAGWKYLAAEASFGPQEHGHAYPPAELELADGSTVRFLGKVDRIDRDANGRIKVIDYKSGSDKKYGDLSPTNPTAGEPASSFPCTVSLPDG